MQQFSSVFSKVTPATLKDTASRLLPPLYNTMDCNCITIITAGISKLLCILDPRKAPGPDNIGPRVHIAVLLHRPHPTDIIRDIIQ